MKYYNRTNTCDRCREECRETKLIPVKTYREYNKEGNWTGKWICNNCYRGFPKERVKKYTDEELLDYLIRFYKKYGRAPVIEDFKNNPEYPSPATYWNRFGNWSNALKLVELDVESMVKKGVIENEYQKGRLGEIIVRDHFKQHPVDLAGENCLSPCDGICPNGKTYDVKSSKFYTDRTRWDFQIRNKYKEEIEIYYLLGFNEDYTKLDYGWRIPGEMAEGYHFYVGLNPDYKFNIENMKEYDITHKINGIIEKEDEGKEDSYGKNMI